MPERLVEEYRGNTLENVYYGHICGIDETGEIIYRAGNPEWVTYMRSAAKPFQAIPALVRNIDSEFGLTNQEIALMAASHRAEQEHVEALESMRLKIGVEEEGLVCSASYPVSMKARDALLIAGEPPRRLYHNCSGKHMGILAYCKMMGYPMEGYDDPEHPAQRDILHVVSEFSGAAAQDIPLGIDGCGLPVFALPLNRIAAMFLKLACPDLIGDDGMRAAAAKIGSAMNEHPDMVSASWFICSNLLRDPNIVAKGGAKGIYSFALRKERLAFALKVLDGSEEKWPLIIASILEQIGYSNQETIDRMYRLAPQEVKNGNGTIVGTQRAVLQFS